jgi:hypothetical protein
VGTVDHHVNEVDLFGGFFFIALPLFMFMILHMADEYEDRWPVASRSAITDFQMLVDGLWLVAGTLAGFRVPVTKSSGSPCGLITTGRVKKVESRVVVMDVRVPDPISSVPLGRFEHASDESTKLTGVLATTRPPRLSASETTPITVTTNRVI